MLRLSKATTSVSANTMRDSIFPCFSSDIYSYMHYVVQECSPLIHKPIVCHEIVHDDALMDERGMLIETFAALGCPARQDRD